MLGYTVVHCGPPDFVIFKMDGEDMTDIEFIEVKPNANPFLMTTEQKIWRCALQRMGCNYKIETPKGVIIAAKNSSWSDSKMIDDYRRKNVLLIS